jgi:hypothetical protein
LDQEDMFVIQVTDPLAFSATTVGTGGGGLIEDSQLFLFNTAGLGVYANDDADGLTRRSTLPAGHLSGSLSAGLYFLAISGFDRDPVGAVDLIFPNFPRSEVSGPSGPDGGTPISGWSGFGDFGPYTILLTGADPVPPSVPPVSVPTPEPSTIILLGILIPIVVIQARQRQRQTAQKNPLDG